ncbi:helix-turn-helix domain-containing protein [Asticcacaulis sp. ZE23SCel15]|uniref:helix-turn-helix domain-containing protein n=1 Tax=Asticcacaulis sp. ZE23SCel15 TaxID=3059027 RepID=UPI00265E899B|nr:helix-turn-helix domain-containing protein [Asticcacaulis sp. ZE23SCel15]WKL58003.1 helix-turn-helix domain-containing protein [Asticcacaulis sp. ZE23SCel15]
MTTSTPAPQNPPKLAYRIDEAVRATGLGRSFLYERMAEGSLKSVKIGGRRLILQDDLMAFLRGAQVVAPDAASHPISQLSSGAKAS